MRLFADVRARVVAGERPAGEEQPDEKAVAIGLMRLHQERRRLVRREERQRADENADARDVDPRGEIVEPRHQPHA